MLSPEANAVLREGCAAFDRANGAAEAAAIIKRTGKCCAMSGSDRKKMKPPGISGSSMNGRFYRIADIYERARQEAGADDTITLSWYAGRRPQPFVMPDPLPPEVDAIWPVRRMPAKPLRPNTGHGAPHAGTTNGALFVTLFGLTEDRLKMAVHRIERQIRPAQDMRPVFLTDHLDTTVFRHAGFTYEYFPPSVFGAEDQAPLFARRLETLWRKWNGGANDRLQRVGLLGAAYS